MPKEQLMLDLQWFDMEDFLAAIGLKRSPWDDWPYWDGECVLLRQEGDYVVIEEWGYDPASAVMDALALGGEMFLESGDGEFYSYGVRQRAPQPHTFDEALETFVRFGRIKAEDCEEVRKEYQYAGFRRVFGGLFGLPGHSA
jgi:hypothetical protein